MTQAQIAQITAAVIAALSAPKKSYPAVAARKPYRNHRVSAAVVDPRLDRALKRRSLVAAGFKRRGITVTFVNETGRFDNVKPYKTWLLEGRIVRRGEHGVKGLFHITQTDVYVAPVVSNIINPVIGMSV